MNKIGIIINPGKDPGLQYLRLVTSLLSEAGYTYAVSSGSYNHPGGFDFCPAEQALEGAALGITLGGDGTLLRAAPYACKRKVPLLGINLGHLGFLAEMDRNEIHRLPQLLSEGFSYTERMMLDIRWLHEGREIRTAALNDAVIKSGNKPAQIVLSDGATDLLDYFCDGFIVASPTGSTAYSMSAGGPILEPGSQSIVVTPICPHTLGSRSVVFGAERYITLRVVNAEKIRAHLVCDGTELGTLSAGDQVRIGRSETPLRMVRLHSESFYHVLNDKISKRFV